VRLLAPVAAASDDGARRIHDERADGNLARGARLLREHERAAHQGDIGGISVHTLTLGR
jgi:hypothetical protein